MIAGARTRALLTVALLVPACAPTMYMHRFGPERVEVQLDVWGYPGEHVLASTAIAGIRQPDPRSGRRPQFEVEFRVENRSRGTALLMPEMLALGAADLRSLANVVVTPEPRPLEPGETVDYLLVFVFPVGETPWEYDLRRLDLFFAFDLCADIVRSRAEFVLFDPVYDPGLRRRHYPQRY